MHETDIQNPSLSFLTMVETITVSCRNIALIMFNINVNSTKYGHKYTS